MGWHNPSAPERVRTKYTSAFATVKEGTWAFNQTKGVLVSDSDKSASFCISGTVFPAPPLAPGLYLVATPIGNLGDISLRALRTLAAADLVLCEDTRTSARLLDHYLITTKRKPFHEHNERARMNRVVSDIGQGAAVALISDAGTPLLSDPGFPLVRAARAAGIDVFPLPGASALLGALVGAGLPTDRFTFIGFLPARSRARQAELQRLASLTHTLVFYESPRRLAATLAQMARSFGGARMASIAFELTKRHERFLSGSLDELVAQLAATPARGEAVILVAGAGEQVVDEKVWKADLAEHLARMSLREAVEQVTSRHSLRRKQVYDAALRLRK